VEEGGETSHPYPPALYVSNEKYHSVQAQNTDDFKLEQSEITTIIGVVVDTG
jgi:hypothetical protein